MKERNKVNTEKKKERRPRSSQDWLAAKMAPTHRAAKVAILLAHALRLQKLIERGEGTLALMARRLDLTQARISQVQDLVLLAPDIQREVVRLKAVNDREPLSDRQLQTIVREAGWEDQRALWRACKDERGIGLS